MRCWQRGTAREQRLGQKSEEKNEGKSINRAEGGAVAVIRFRIGGQNAVCLHNSFYRIRITYEGASHPGQISH